MSSDKKVGKVIWFNNRRGFGFIKRESESDLFVHWSDIDCDGYKTLKKNQIVSYNIGLNHEGRPKATEVVVIEE